MSQKRAILVAVVLQLSSISQMQTDVWVVSVSSVTCTSKQFQHYKLQFSADDNEEEVGVDNDVWGEERGFNIEFPCQPLSALTVRTSTGQCVERKINAKSFQLQLGLSMSRRQNVLCSVKSLANHTCFRITIDRTRGPKCGDPGESRLWCGSGNNAEPLKDTLTPSVWGFETRSQRFHHFSLL